MTAVKYQTKAGVAQFMPQMTASEYGEVDGGGFCLACGSEASGVEPDARKYECESCGAHKVYGIEELLMMDLVRID